MKVKTRVPFHVGRNSDIPAEMVSFTELSIGNEHIALVFNGADQKQTVPLVRIHSECLTGDVFGSSRCDCGEQLNEAIEKMNQDGGILLYLRQEGRGIGLYNKLEAYNLQISGLDTYSANNQLGFADDMRDFGVAADMLKALNINKIDLMTNNPEKVASMKKYDICVQKVIPTGVFIKKENKEYLMAKSHRGGHKISLN